MGGGLMQLVAYGAQDIYLTGNPQITFFKVVYRRHTNFSMETIQQTISGSSTIDSSLTSSSGIVTISRNGDLLHNVYVRCDQDTENGITGDQLIKEVEIEIGGQKIDKHTREWLQVWAELTTPESKAAGYKYLTGGFNNSIVSGSETSQQSIMVPLQFWFCRNPGLALPLIALQYHEVKLKFTWGISSDLTRNGSSGFTLNPKCEVWCDYIYLDTDERRRFAQVSHEYLIEQLQVQTEGSAATKYKLNLNHPVKELVWTNTSANITSEKTKLQLNGHDRFADQDREYFQIRQPLDHHTAVPGYNIKESERPQLLNNPIIVTSGTTTSTVDVPNVDTEFQVLASTISNLKIFSTTAADVVIKAGDVLNISYVILADSDEDVGDESIIITVIVNRVEVAASNGGVAEYNVSFAGGMGPSTNTPIASIAGSGSITIVARTQDPKSRCSQLARDVNVYSFALKPEEHQPSGTCNFSRIDNAHLMFSGSVTVDNIYAVNYNVLRIMSGMGGLAYSN